MAEAEAKNPPTSSHTRIKTPLPSKGRGGRRPGWGISGPGWAIYLIPWRSCARAFHARGIHQQKLPSHLRGKAFSTPLPFKGRGGRRPGWGISGSGWAIYLIPWRSCARAFHARDLDASAPCPPFPWAVYSPAIILVVCRPAVRVWRHHQPKQSIRGGSHGCSMSMMSNISRKSLNSTPRSIPEP